MRNVVAMILAGGQGTRLGVLTEEIAKPAVPFGGKYRIIDFTLSNCVNSGVYKIGVLTQYKPRILNRHIGIGRPWDLDVKDGGVEILPPYQASDENVWYRGTADAVYQNLDFIDQYDPDYVLILSGDHVYAMDYNDLVDFHISKFADGTIACMDVPIIEANRFGIMVTDLENRIIEFQEKPEKPKSTLASLGIYVFKWKFLRKILIEDSKNENSSHDFGKDIIPKIIEENLGNMFAFEFDGYWKDVGTIESYWQSNLELTKPIPPFNLYDPNWKFYTQTEEMPPAFVADKAVVVNSLISEGCEIYGEIENSVIFQGVIVEEGAIVKDSVIMTKCRIGKNTTIEKAVISERATIRNDVTIGIGEEAPNIERPDIYTGGITTIGNDVTIPDGVKIGKNCAVYPRVTEKEFKGITKLESGGVIKRT
ncbi:MAG TPA: glucose-1-phosphate adenylyltransferase [Thermotogaceae bacterium]|nr:glucose-1-phosphate adenylyltransferase [Thermotogaceae bacterium]